MILSSLYHTFSCRSERDFHSFLSFDLFGIALSLLAIYTSGIFYAFWCQKVKCDSTFEFRVLIGIFCIPKDLQNFYLITVTLIFVVAMILQIPSLNVNVNVKMFVFVAWAAYGVVPTLHWTIKMGGMENPLVAVKNLQKTPKKYS